MTLFLDTKSLLTCTLSVSENVDFKVLSGQTSNFILMPNSDLIETISFFPLNSGSVTVPEITLDYIDDTKQNVKLNLTDNSLTNDIPRHLLVKSSNDLNGLARIRIFPNSG